MKLGVEVGLGLGHIMLNGDPAPAPTAPPLQKGYISPYFSAYVMSTVAKRSPIWATAEHLYIGWQWRNFFLPTNTRFVHAMMRGKIWEMFVVLTSLDE